MDVTSGASMIYNIAGASDFNIVCTVVVENMTNHPLLYPYCYIDTGEIKSPPVAVRPRHKESFIANNGSNSMAGSAGIASWKIKDLEGSVVVMWNCPYSPTRISNWLGVGITTGNIEENGEILYKHMFNGTSMEDLKHIQGKYFNSLKTLSIKGQQIEITGIMGTSQKTTAHIVVETISNDKVDPALV